MEGIPGGAPGKIAGVISEGIHGRLLKLIPRDVPEGIQTRILIP